MWRAWRRATSARTAPRAGRPAPGTSRAPRWIHSAASSRPAHTSSSRASIFADCSRSPIRPYAPSSSTQTGGATPSARRSEPSPSSRWRRPRTGGSRRTGSRRSSDTPRGRASRSARRSRAARRPVRAGLAAVSASTVCSIRPSRISVIARTSAFSSAIPEPGARISARSSSRISRRRCARSATSRCASRRATRPSASRRDPGAHADRAGDPERGRVGVEPAAE